MRIDLLNQDWFYRLNDSPSLLVQHINELKLKKNSWIIIDEIQKIPALLDIVHDLIERKGLLFALTGSSGRKLKRGSANLLAGRAINYSLFPLTATELGKKFNLLSALQWGTLPTLYSKKCDKNSELKMDYLRSYTDTYLREEIIAEQMVRKVQPFRQFLNVAAQCHGKILNYTKIARDINIDTATVQSYFEILQDTLIGQNLETYHTSLRKRIRANPKFYFFDLGVVSALKRNLNLGISPSTSHYGELFETFIINEMKALACYKKLDWQFFYLRTKDDAEIDLIIERPGMPLCLVDIKSTSKISTDHTSSFIKFSKDFGSAAESFVLSQDTISQKHSHVHCLHWKVGLKEIGL